MNDSVHLKPSVTESLCLTCGLCCNGVIFADVKLQAGDDAAWLKKLGLPVSTPRAATSAQRGQQGRNPTFAQPCAALEGCRCRIYKDRPRYCREFECLLFKKVAVKKIKRSSALKLIRTAREQAEEVRRLLRDVGDQNEHLPLRLRFQQAADEIERDGLTAEKQDSFAQLTLAMHDLNLMLSTSFYPGH